MKILLTLFCLSLPLCGYSQDMPPTYPTHYFTFIETDSTSYPVIYPDQRFRDIIAKQYQNTHKLAKQIEVYGLKNQQIDFLHRLKDNKKKWSLELTNGEEITFGPNPGSYIADYNFEYYYPSIEMIVFRAQWEEGNNYLVVSRKSGNKTSMYGPPVFSPSQKYAISYNGSEFASHNKNGIQLFKLTNKGLKKIIEYETDLAPSRIKWEKDDTFSLEMYDSRIVKKKGMIRTYQHYATKIKETNY